MGFFKSLGKGCLYFLLSPLILAGFAIWCVFSLFVFIFLGIVSIVKFFKGESLTLLIKEDQEAIEIIDEATKIAQNQQTTIQPQQQATTNNNVTNTFNLLIQPGVDPSKVISAIKEQTAAIPAQTPVAGTIDLSNPQAIENKPIELIEESKPKSTDSFEFDKTKELKHEE